MGWLNWQALVSTECFLWIKNPHKNPYWQKFWKGGRYVPRNALPGAVSSCNSILSAAFSLCKYRKYELGAEGSVKLYLVMCSAWDVRQITCIQEEMDFKSQIKANIPNQLGWWRRFLVFELTLSAFPGQAFFFLFKLMKLRIWFLTRLFICEKRPSAWSLSNAIWTTFRVSGMKKDILRLTEECILQEPVNPCSSYLTFRAYLFSSRQH